MGRVQIVAVGVTVLLSALDGYDVLSVSFAAPAITKDWGIDKAMLGVVLSSSLVGMAIGSFAIAPVADLLGRRRLVFVSLALMAIGSLLCAGAGSLAPLAAWRIVTGRGIGTCVAVINPLAAEFSNRRRRSLSVALMALGYPAGGLVGGLLAAALLHGPGWRSVFVAGFGASAALVPVVALLLPESPAFLSSRVDPVNLPSLNALLGRLGQPTLSAMPAREPGRRGYGVVFARASLPLTVRLACINLLAAAVIYYVLSWLPQLVSDAGFASSTASLVSAVLSLAGIVGGLILGAAADRIGPSRAAVIATVGLGCFTAALGLVPASLPLLIAAAAACGFFIFATGACVYAVLARSFDDRARASGSGFVIGVGRVSSAIAPLVAGELFAAHFSRAGVSAVFGAGAIGASLLLATLPSPKEPAS